MAQLRLSQLLNPRSTGTTTKRLTANTTLDPANIDLCLAKGSADYKPAFDLHFNNRVSSTKGLGTMNTEERQALCLAQKTKQQSLKSSRQSSAPKYSIDYKRTAVEYNKSMCSFEARARLRTEQLMDFVVKYLVKKHHFLNIMLRF